MRSVTGHMETIMAGLCCGVPSVQVRKMITLHWHYDIHWPRAGPSWEPLPTPSCHVRTAWPAAAWESSTVRCPTTRGLSQVWVSQSQSTVNIQRFWLLYIVDLNEASEYLGESGAVCLGALYTLMTDTGAEAREMRAALGLSEGSRVLCVSTEGDTDPEGFRDNIWGWQQSSQLWFKSIIYVSTYRDRIKGMRHLCLS